MLYCSLYFFLILTYSCIQYLRDASISSSLEGHHQTEEGYGKDSFLEQPYEPFESLKLFLHSIYAIVYEKSLI
jgi:hypothetical protein